MMAHLGRDQRVIEAPTTKSNHPFGESPPVVSADSSWTDMEVILTQSFVGDEALKSTLK